MIASRVVVVSGVVAELAFRMKLPGIHDVDVSALYPIKFIDKTINQIYCLVLTFCISMCMDRHMYAVPILCV